MILIIILNTKIGISQIFPEQYPGFPILLAHAPDGGPLLTGPVFADVDKDGFQEIIVNADNKLFLISKDGEILSGWPQETADRIQQNASLADLDGDDTLDIVVIDRGWGTEDHYLYVWNIHGQLFPDFPISVALSVNQPKTPTLYDFDNDGLAEILYQNENEIIIIDNTGIPLPGWPVIFESRPQTYQIGHFNDDDSVQIVIEIEASDSLYLLRTDGTRFVEPICPQIDNYRLQTFSVADFDRDGKSEIFLGMYKDVFPSDGYAVALYTLDAGILPGWPQFISSGYIFQPGSWADLVGDDHLEVIWVDLDGFLHAYESDGSALAGFPVRPFESTSAGADPVIGDVDGDGELEIFVDNNSSFDDTSHYHVYHPTGEEVGWSPLLTPVTTCFNNPALGDINNDGLTDIALIVDDPYTWDVYLWVFTIPGIVYESGQFPWPMHAHDPQHTYWYDYKWQIPDKVDEPYARPDQHILLHNYPNPFNRNTIIEYNIPQLLAIKVTVHDIQGKYVQTLVDESQQVGLHKITWNGLDAASKMVSAGEYLIRLEAGQFLRTIKILYLP